MGGRKAKSKKPANQRVVPGMTVDQAPPGGAIDGPSDTQSHASHNGRGHQQVTLPHRPQQGGPDAGAKPAGSPAGSQRGSQHSGSQHPGSQRGSPPEQGRPRSGSADSAGKNAPAAPKPKPYGDSVG